MGNEYKTSEEKMNLMVRLAEAKVIFRGSQYEADLHKPFESYGDIENRLNRLPTRKQLMEQLLEKLKKKSAYKNLKKVAEGTTKTDFEILKGLFSFGTHVCIECGSNKEYRILLPNIYEKIGSLIYKLNCLEGKINESKS